MTTKNQKSYLEEEISLLKITINHLATENSDFRQKIEDLKITHQSNKDLLKEYLSQITNKDSTVQKLSNTIEQLKTRLKNLEITPTKRLLKESEVTNEYANESLRAINKGYQTSRPNRKTTGSGTGTPQQKPKEKKNSSLKSYNKYLEGYQKLVNEIKELKEALNVYITDEYNNENVYKIELIPSKEEGKFLSQNQEEKEMSSFYFVDKDKRIWELIPVNTIKETDLQENKVMLSEDEDTNIEISGGNNIEEENEDISVSNIEVDISKCSSLFEEGGSQFKRSLSSEGNQKTN